MPYRLFHSRHFDAKTIKRMSAIFDEICIELGLAHREDRIRDTVARAIIRCVEQGRRDPEDIRRCARNAFRPT